MKKKQGIILKEGEVTGHAHRAVGDLEFDTKTKKLTLKEDEVKVIHEEHDTVKITKKDDIRVDDVVEYDPISEELRKVAD